MARARWLGAFLTMEVTARIDYGIRVVVELAGGSREAPRKLRDLAAAQAIPPAFLADVLTRLRHAGVVRSRRGAEGGYWLARPAIELSLGSVIRAVEGSVMEVRGQALDEVVYVGRAVALRDVWMILRSALELVTVADVADGKLPPSMLAMTDGSASARLGARMPPSPGAISAGAGRARS